MPADGFRKVFAVAGLADLDYRNCRHRIGCNLVAKSDLSDVTGGGFVVR
jgi:hypothetical protein